MSVVRIFLLDYSDPEQIARMCYCASDRLPNEVAIAAEAGNYKLGPILTLDDATPDRVFMHTQGRPGFRSTSVGDVIQIDDEFHAVDAIGFVQLDSFTPIGAVA